MSTRWKDVVCTNDQAREYFDGKGLTYADICETDIRYLMAYLSEELENSNKTGETSVNTMDVNSKYKITTDGNGHIVSCYITMKCHYFKDRECISFDRGGFIGFAGWADPGNLNPIKRAFIRWCDMLVEKKVKYDA